jgi:homoserine kinase
MKTLRRPILPLHLRLPATSANLGPGFDTAAVALNLHLEVTARLEGTFSIAARGRDSEACGKVEGNLIFDTYRRILTDCGQSIQPLHLDVSNEIPLGMGCGSSAAARLAGIVLAVHYRGLGWREDEVLAAATYLEGHPDNATACWMGSMTVATVCRRTDAARQNAFPRVHAARIDVPAHWRAVMVLPSVPVQTEESRRVLPEQYDRADVIENLQHCGLLVAAFASGQSELLRAAMHDTLHQPYRSSICPLLGKLLPLRRESGVLGVALSGAGPGVLLVVERELSDEWLNRAIQPLLGSATDAEVVPCDFCEEGARKSLGNLFA